MNKDTICITNRLKLMMGRDTSKSGSWLFSPRVWAGHPHVPVPFASAHTVPSSKSRLFVSLPFPSSKSPNVKMPCPFKKLSLRSCPASPNPFLYPGGSVHSAFLAAVCVKLRGAGCFLHSQCPALCLSKMPWVYHMAKKFSLFQDRIINLVVGSLTSLLILVTLISAFVFPQLPPKPLNIFFCCLHLFE